MAYVEMFPVLGRLEMDFLPVAAIVNMVATADDATWTLAI